jgi:lactoylglutathione lyase
VVTVDFSHRAHVLFRARANDRAVSGRRLAIPRRHGLVSLEPTIVRVIMRYLHTMLRVRNLDAALDFYCNKFGLKEVRRTESQQGRFTLVFLAAPDDEGLVSATASSGFPAPLVELTYNWDGNEDYGEARYFGHLAYEVDDIYANCEKLMKAGVTINRPPRDGRMAFIRSPDRHSIELLQKGNALPPQEPWSSMPNTGHW